MGQTSRGILPTSSLTRSEHMPAAIAGGAGQLACDACPSGRNSEVTARRASPKCAIGNRKAEEFFAAVELGLLAGIQRRPLFAAHRIHQHHAGHFFRIEQRKAAHHQPAKGMSHQNVGRLDAGFLQHLMQFRGDLRGRARGAAGAAPAQSAAIVGSRAVKRETVS